jgi:hypothetical protein
MDAKHDWAGALRAMAVRVISALGVGLVGLIIGELLPPALGSAVRTFFEILSTAILSVGIADVFWPTRLLPAMIVLRRWLWLSMAVGFASIRYLTEAGDVGPAKLIACVVIGLGLTAFAGWWITAARRQRFASGR